MTPADWQRISEIFSEALDLSPDQRETFLNQACNGNADLRREVEAMLRAEGDSGGFLEASSTSVPGDLPGGWKLFEQIGEGGMGQVYRAMRAAEGFTQVAAVKILPHAHLTPEFARRLRVERSVLAKLQHPNITRLLDGGSANGVPFLVMELIDKGQPLIEYCSALSLRERLQVFLKICSAVQYAHQHLVVHRDIKPSNILVTQEGEPKLLDFGIAKLLVPELDSSNEKTSTLYRAVSLHYSSPEQLRGETVTTATDIYSLGTLLFEILTGTRRELGTVTTPEAIAKHIEESPVPKPSSVNKSVHPDLDAIVGKAVRAEADQRYSSVEQLAADIQRHLDGLPVLAREGTWKYHASKWVARHKTGAALAAGLGIGLVGFVWASYETAKARDLAEAQLRETREIAGLMAMQAPNQFASVPGSLPLRRKMVQFGLAHLDQLMSERDPSDVEQRRRLALGYFNMANALGGANTTNVGDYDGAIRCYRKSIDLLWEDAASSRRDTVSLNAMRRAHRSLLGDLQRLRRLPEALKAAEDCIVKAPSIDADSAAIVALGCRFQRIEILNRMGQTASDFEVDAVLKDALEKIDSPEFASGIANAQLRLAYLFLGRKDYGKALEHAKLGLDTSPKNRNPELSLVKTRLMVIAGLAEYRSGEQDAGRTRFEECFDLLREIVRREPSDVESRGELARALFESLETIPDDIGLHHARMVEAESLARAIVKDIDHPEGRFLLVRILGKQAELQNNDCALRQKALDEYQKIVNAGLALPGDKQYVDEIRNRQCGGGHG